MASTQILDTDSEDEMPAGWEERVTIDGKVYYANHELQTTQWTHPASGKRKRVAGELPYGWERKVNAENNVYFVDHIHQKTTYTDPRLAFAQEDKGGDGGQKHGATGIKQRFDGATYAMTVLQGRDLSGHHAIVTGANSGIGFETARALALHGCHVVLACRDAAAGHAAIDALRTERPQVTLTLMHLDLMSLASVRDFARAYIAKKWPLHYLILNAGIFCPPFTLSEDGYESTFQTNHLGHYYLATLLTETLLNSSPARVVVVSAESHRFCSLSQATISESELSPPSPEAYTPLLAYNQSKLCNLLFSNEFNRRYQSRGVTCNAVHPGNTISTGLSRQWWGWRLLFLMVRPFTKTKGQGAATSVFAATARELEGYGGYFFNNCFNVECSEAAKDVALATTLWDYSELMVLRYENRAAEEAVEEAVRYADYARGGGAGIGGMGLGMAMEEVAVH